VYISKKHLSRRTLLRGAGVAVALPLLDAMVPASTAIAQTAAAAKPRLGFVYFPHGAVMSRWTPTKTGRDFDMTPLLEPLAPYRDHLTVVSGLENKPAISPAVHGITPGTWLSCVPPRVSHDPYGGVSIDQIAAAAIGQDTPLPSLEIATEEGTTSGACDRGYGCAYAGTVSFRTPTTPLPMEANPRKLFERLFGRGDNPAERAALASEYSSILDMVASQTADLRLDLGSSDRAMLDSYLETVREIERRVAKLEQRDLSSLDLPEAPMGVPDDFDEHLNLMFDIAALAMQANLTRVFTFMMTAEASNRTYGHIGVQDAFHPLSHHQDDPARIDRLAVIQRYHAETFAKFVSKLATLQDGDGSMLDNSIILFGSNMSNSNLHDHFPLPSAVLGHGAGTIRGNQHIRYPDRTPHANLLLTLLDRAGVPAETVGDAQGEISEV
jgi:hypothetical protein